jgi:hypothetical protein
LLKVTTMSPKRLLPLLICCASAPAVSAAQVPPPPPPTPDLLPRTVQDAWLLERSPEYRSGKRRRFTGTLLSTVGPAAGGLLALGGYLVIRSARDDDARSCDDAMDSLACGTGSAYGSGLKGVAGLTMAISGGVIAVGTLAAGIPLIVSGQRRMNRARQQAPELSFAAGPGQAALSARWRF